MEKWIPSCFKQRFNNDLRELYTIELQKNREFGHELWSALANVSWVHDDDPKKEEYGYSFRAAGSLIDSILLDSDYMEWYCASPDRLVSERIAKDMAEKGWTPRFD